MTSPSADTRTLRVVKKDGKAKGFPYGVLSFSEHRNGWRFISHTPHRNGSRRTYDTAIEAFPKWLRRDEVELIPVDRP